VLPGRVRTLVAVAVVFLASAPAAAAQSAPAYVRLSVVRTITWIGWSAGPDGTYRATIYLRPYVFEVPYVAGSLSASSNASASRR
jgi:ABC-type glycerol-3-phosphate transport system substrate-binding protein